MCATGECSLCSGLRDFEDEPAIRWPGTPPVRFSERYRDAHPCCLSCEKPGCLRAECPGDSCDIEALVTCRGELVHRGCVGAFEKLVDNVITICAGCQRASDRCSCAIPVATDEEETTPVEPLTNDEIAKLDPLGVFSKEAA